MNARIYFILAFTFITGMFAGAYLYITSFAPYYQQSDIEEISDVGFRILGQMTGGCQMAGVCPSFRLNQDRTYEYVPEYSLQDGEPQKMTGKIDSAIFESLVVAVQEADKEGLQKTNTLSCSSYVDGIDYEYQLNYKGVMYDLRTCGMNFKNSALDKTLAPLWSELAITPKQIDPLEGGMNGFLENQLKKRF